MYAREYYLNELYHHGVKGQKWGVRRYQNPDGTLTPEGKRKYGTVDNFKRSMAAQNKQRSDEKSSHRTRLEEKYRSEGMSKIEAQKAVEKRIKTEKIIAATAAMTVAAASAYVINKNIKYKADKIIKSGTKLQRIAGMADENLDRAFYASYKKMDNMKYRGLYGNQMKNTVFKTTDDVYKHTLNVNKDVKIASRKKAEDAFMDLYKNDPDFRDKFLKTSKQLDSFGMLPKRDSVIKSVGENMTDKQLRKSGYDAFNINLANHFSNDANEISKKFYDKLKSQVYDGISDVNYKKYSVFKSKAPTILFEKGDKISVSKTEKLSDEAIKKDLMKSKVAISAPVLAETGALYVGVPVGMTNATSKIQVENSKRLHPGTRMTDRQILNMLRKSKYEDSKWK